MGAVAKTFDRIIPNEIKPIVPVAASMFGGPLLGSVIGGTGIGALLGRYGTQALASGLTAAGTGALMGQKFDPRTVGISALFGGLGSRLGDIQGTSKLATAGKRLGQVLAPTKYNSTTGFSLTGTGDGFSALTQPLTVAATTGGTISAMDAAEKAREEYDRMMEEQGMTEAADTNARKDYIQRYMNLAGFSQEEIDDALSRYGYAKGGRAGYSEGGKTLGESMSDMSIPYMKYKIIEAGGGGWGGKDLDDKTDSEIREIYLGMFAEEKAKGGRIGYKIGGPVKTFIAKLLGAEPNEEVLNKLFEERKKEIFNSMFDPEVPSTNYSMKQMQEADDIATKQAMKELEEYKMSLGMNMDNPPEGTVGASVIEQIMGPRKEGRVEEANGGRIKYAEGGSDTEKRNMISSLMFKLAKGDISETEVINILSEMMFDSAKGKKNGGRIKYAGGKMVKKQNTGRVSQLFQQIEDGVNVSEAMAELLNVYGIDLYDTKAEGGIMNLKMGGMPAEMDLRPGGFVPIGVKEKADDVPARLSKNEFVMTADAVRAAGGGSVNKGAQKMYELMNSLEARV